MSDNRPKSSTSVWSYVVVIGIIIGACSMIVFGPHEQTRDNARQKFCQANMNKIGKALKSYMADWDGHFPTNRDLKGKLTANVPLTPENPQDFICKYGPNWVESLYFYIEKVGNPGDNNTVWKCANAMRDQARGSSACITYALNMNLVEQTEGIIKDPGHTMMVRELDREFDAVCRPINICKDAKTRPIGAFLTHSDPQLPQGTPINYKLHGGGYSNILFTDGHVKCISTSLMPPDAKLYWDIQTKQWWNSGEAEKKVIAITP